MDITPLVRKDWQIINGYGDGGFTCRDDRHQGSVLVTREQVYPLSLTDIKELTIEHFAELKAHEPAVELLLLGCGPQMAPIDAQLRRTVREWGIVIELMDTGAACRTYNVLLVEERRVAALLIAGLWLGLARRLSGSLWVCFGLHAGWVLVIQSMRRLSAVNDEAAASGLVGQFDGFIGWLAAGMLLLAGLLSLRRLSTTSK